MVKKTTEQAIIILIIFAVVVAVLVLSYVGNQANLHTMKEDPAVADPYFKETVKYNTEFCAYKLNNLLEELHFVEDTIEEEKKILGTEDVVEQQEERVIGIETGEITDIKEEFERYKNLCDQLDAQKDAEICAAFLEETQQEIDSTEEKKDAATGFTEKAGVIFKELRTAKRMHKEMQKFCR